MNMKATVYMKCMLDRIYYILNLIILQILIFNAFKLHLHEKTFANRIQNL